eukprot:gene203-9835_t
MRGTQWLLLLGALYVAFTNCLGKDANNKEVLYDIEVDIDRILDTQTVVATTDADKNDPSTIDVAAFNVRIFGRTKASSSFVMGKLVKIVLRYDLILIQEIRDSSETAIQKLLTDVNNSGSKTYALVQSDRLGRTSSKEQYAFLYRSDIFTIGSHYVYDDSANDVFEREPFVVKFNSNIMALSSFIAIGIHTSPSDAESEIDHLVDVYNDAKSRLGTSDAIIMGDFNAGCSYVSDWSSIRLATDRRFYWLINDVEDTTSSNTECAYDRLVVAGKNMIDAVDPLSPSVLHFDSEFGLSSSEALKVSDHYPVQMKIRTKQDSERTSLTRMIKVEDKGSITAIPTVPLNPQGYIVERLFGATGTLLGFLLKFQASDLAQGIVNLKKLKTDMDPFVSSIQISSAERQLKDISMVKFLPKNNGVYFTLRDYYQGVPRLYTVSAKCEIAKKRCMVMEEVQNAF